MKVVFVHQYFIDPSHPAATRPYDLVRALAMRGHDVVVVTGAVALHTREYVVPHAPHAGVRVIALPLYRGYGRSFARRLANNFEFLWRAVRAARKETEADLYYGSALPIFAPLAALLAARGKPFVFELRDLFPESLEVIPGPVSAFARIIARPLVALLYRAAKLVVLVSPAFVDHALRYGACRDRIAVVPHGADLGAFNAEAFPGNVRRVVYAGALGHAQGVEFFGQLSRALPPETEVHVYGDGPEAGAVRDLARDIPNLHYHGAVPKEEVPHVLASAGVCLLPLRDVPVFRTVLPNKLFEYMAAGRPTVITFGGIAADLLEREGAGVLARDPDTAARAIEIILSDRELRQRMATAARAAAERDFDRERIMNGLVDRLEASVQR